MMTMIMMVIQILINDDDDYSPNYYHECNDVGNDSNSDDLCWLRMIMMMYSMYTLLMMDLSRKGVKMNLNICNPGPLH